jgi:hypothetical protein
MTTAVAKMLGDLKSSGSLKGSDVANIAAVSPATVSRWLAGTAFPHPKTQLIMGLTQITNFWGYYGTYAQEPT